MENSVALSLMVTVSVVMWVVVTPGLNKRQHILTCDVILNFFIGVNSHMFTILNGGLYMVKRKYTYHADLLSCLHFKYVHLKLCHSFLFPPL